MNGGEHSLLSVLDHTPPRFAEFLALAPDTGPLADALQSRGLSPIPFNVRDKEGNRRSRNEVLSELKTTLNHLGCDLVHANSLSIGRLTGAIASDLQMPATAHLRDILKLSKAAVTDLNQNTQLVAVSEATREFHLAQGFDSHRVRTIYNGVDCEKFRPRPANKQVRQQLGLSPDVFLALNVGQIGLRKGQDVLAEAATLAAGTLPHARYVLAGQRCSEKQESREFEQQVIASFQRQGEENLGQLIGYSQNMPSLMNTADLLVHPAHQEPLGRVILEAAASGLPILATDVGGTSEMVRNGESAVLVPPGNPAELATAIIKLAQDPVLRTQLANAARERMETRYTIQQAAMQLQHFWQSVGEVA